MNNRTPHDCSKVENYNFMSDFQILTLKEKRGILKNAKTLLKLQNEDSVLVFGSTPLPNKENKT